VVFVADLARWSERDCGFVELPLPPARHLRARPTALEPDPEPGILRLVRSLVADGDTVTLRNGQPVRLVQIDTPEVYFGTECYGPQASATTKAMLPPGARVRLFREPATDSVDQYGRLLRYVVRAKDGLNVNVQLVRVGAAAPYFYRGRRRQGRRPAGTARPSSESPEGRSVGTLPVRPDPRGQPAKMLTELARRAP
jgi:endonuclease YncB( thermonuclease family)